MPVPQRKLGKKVSPLSAEDIRGKAFRLRKAIGQKRAYVKIVNLLELLQNFEFLEFAVVEDHELSEEEAVTYPDKRFMCIKQSVYEKAADGDGHCRFTIAHELGHLCLHRGQSRYARGITGAHKIFEDSEWQADTFASEFLIDQRLIPENADECDISEMFGVSLSAARRRLEKYKAGK